MRRRATSGRGVVLGSWERKLLTAIERDPWGSVVVRELLPRGCRHAIESALFRAANRLVEKRLVVARHTSTGRLELVDPTVAADPLSRLPIVEVREDLEVPLETWGACCKQQARNVEEEPIETSSGAGDVEVANDSSRSEIWSDRRANLDSACDRGDRDPRRERGARDGRKEQPKKGETPAHASAVWSVKSSGKVVGK